jgi:hypothetical protein
MATPLGGKPRAWQSDCNPASAICSGVATTGRCHCRLCAWHHGSWHAAFAGFFSLRKSLRGASTRVGIDFGDDFNQHVSIHGNRCVAMDAGGAIILLNAVRREW